MAMWSSAAAPLRAMRHQRFDQTKAKITASAGDDHTLFC
jgi:hypothetical protein